MEREKDYWYSLKIIMFTCEWFSEMYILGGEKKPSVLSKVWIKKE